MTHARRLFCVCFLFSSMAAAQSDRAGVWDAGFHVADYSSLSLYGFGGAAMQIESDTGWGFSGSYNFSDHFALGLDASWRRPNYRATFVPQAGGPTRVIDTRMEVSRIHLKGAYYFLDSHVTPFVEVGYGWTRIDSNILEGPPITGCWWDPWWGLVCRSFYSTFTETKPSYGAAFGVRWDTSTDISLRGSVGFLEIDRGRGVSDSDVSVTQLELIWRF